jgi:myo-inositol-1(or 4)-monophosphatase
MLNQMESLNMESVLQQLVEAVRQVGDEVVMPYFLKVARQQKEDGSVLTEADIAAQAALQPRLQSIVSAPVLGEEMPPEQQQACWDAGLEALWCVDPIDGTSNFAGGLPYFCISVALLRHGKPSLGVVYAPALKEMFYASAGHGAFLNGMSLPAVNYAPSMQAGVGAIDFKRLNRKLAVALATDSPYYSQRNFGASALEWCYLAAGRFDLYLHGGQHLWDYAAGLLILLEAGGQATTMGNDIFWNDPCGNCSALAAGNLQLFAPWKSWVNANE